MGRLEPPRQEKISCTGTTSPAIQPRKDPFYIYSLSPHLSFNIQQGPLLSGLSGCLDSVADLIYKIRNQIRFLTKYGSRTSFMVKICKEFTIKYKILFLVQDNDIYFFMDLHKGFPSAGRSIKREHPAFLNKKFKFFSFSKPFSPSLIRIPCPDELRSYPDLEPTTIIRTNFVLLPYRRRIFLDIVSSMNFIYCTLWHKDFNYLALPGRRGC